MGRAIGDERCIVTVYLDSTHFHPTLPPSTPTQLASAFCESFYPHHLVGPAPVVPRVHMPEIQHVRIAQCLASCF